MNAYTLREKGNDDAGMYVVFANTVSEAKSKVYSTDLDPDEYIDIRVKRAPEFDGMEKATERELALKQWKEGWAWFDYPDMPEPDHSEDSEFIAFYNEHLAAPYELEEEGADQ